jgi:1,4-dihydroxy-2-naphthoyl-CoA hydrolase
MSIWQKQATLEALNAVSKMTMTEQLGIEFVEIGDDYLKATMPVDHRTVQPYGILHGGASVSLAESLGSTAGYLCLAGDTKLVVGQEINANHLRPVTSGFVTGAARPIHLGNSTQVWEIRITNQDDKLVCISRLTLAVLDRAAL